MAIRVIATGGTIASLADPQTGAVRPAVSAEELVAGVPGLDAFGPIVVEEVARVKRLERHARHHARGLAARSRRPRRACCWRRCSPAMPRTSAGSHDRHGDAGGVVGRPA
jgi:hypothetical protein